MEWENEISNPSNYTLESRDILSNLEVNGSLVLLQIQSQSKDQYKSQIWEKRSTENFHCSVDLFVNQGYLETIGGVIRFTLELKHRSLELIIEDWDLYNRIINIFIKRGD